MSGGDAGKQHAFTYDDGSIVVLTSFFNSTTNSVGVGRANVSGRLTREKIGYTDMVYVTNGTGTIVDDESGQSYPVKRGDFVLLPRGLDMEGRDFHDYIHFSASFETQPNAHVQDHPKVQILHPEELKNSDFEKQGSNLRHVYYTGEGNVQVRVWTSASPDYSTDFFVSPWSELFFVIAGTGSLTSRSGDITQLVPGHSYLIPKGAELKIAAHELKKLAVVFDQNVQAKHAASTSK